MAPPPTPQLCGRCKVLKPQTDFSPTYRGKRGTWCRDCLPVSCGQCGTSYVPKQLKLKAKFCSRRCKDDARNAILRSEREAAKPDRACIWCSSPMPKSMRSDAKFCSERCNSSAHSATRKAAQRAGLKNRNGDLISLAYIAERDRWRCGICGGKVGKGRRHPDPLAGSIDHIVPLSQGGDPTEPANLQLAHLVCNLRKQNRPTGEQLRLLG